MTMQQISFKTARGADVSLQIITERELDIDHNVKVPCHDLRITLNGRRYGCGVDLIEQHADGPHLKLYTDGIRIGVPAEHLAGVRELLDGYKAEVSRHIKESLKREGAYRKPRARNSYDDEHDDEIALHGGRR
jgi:hypothetical protein